MDTKPSEYAQRDFVSLIIYIFAWLWVVSISIGGPLLVMISTTIFTQAPNWYYSLLQLTQGILIALPTLILSVTWRNPYFRSIYRTWFAASCSVIILASVHIPVTTSTQIQSLMRISASAIFIVFLVYPTKQKDFNQDTVGNTNNALNSLPWLIAIQVGILFTYPWLIWGALGSPIDTLLEFVSAVIISLSIILTINKYLLADPEKSKDLSSHRFFNLGLSIAMILIIFGSATGYPYGVMQIILILSLFPLGWIIFALITYNRHSSVLKALPLNHPSLWLLIIAIAAPTLFVDADELSLILSLGRGEVLEWAVKAAFFSVLIGGFASVMVSRFLPSWVSTQSTKISVHKTLLVGIAVTIFSGGVLYFRIGQPGFFGEGLFVIFKDQADLSGAAEIEDNLERRRFIYRTLVRHAEHTQADLKTTLYRLGVDYTPYYLVNSIQVQGGPLLKLWLLSRPEIDQVLANPWMRPLPAPRPIQTGKQAVPSETTWNVSLIHAQRVWEEFGITGKGITIGQSDSGVDWEHPELAEGYRGNASDHNYNWLDPWYNTQTPSDTSGHGTHSLGVILGKNVGVAPGASWFGCVNLARNLGNPALYLDCMQFIFAPYPISGDPFQDGDPSRGADIANNSWGCPEFEGCEADTLLPAVKALRMAGIFVVASAGNDGPFCNSLNDPIAIYEDVFSVGAIDNAGQLSFYSSLGPVTADGSGRIKPDLVAPGDEVLSSMPEGTYDTNSGTSFAGPHVAGVVALMWSANPELIGKVELTEEILIETAQPNNSTLPDCEGADDTPSTAVGYGIVDAYEAVKMAIEWKPR